MTFNWEQKGCAIISFRCSNHTAGFVMAKKSSPNLKVVVKSEETILKIDCLT